MSRRRARPGIQGFYLDQVQHPSPLSARGFIALKNRGGEKIARISLRDRLGALMLLAIFGDALENNLVVDGSIEPILDRCKGFYIPEPISAVQLRFEMRGDWPADK